MPPSKYHTKTCAPEVLPIPAFNAQHIHTQLCIHIHIFPSTLANWRGNRPRLFPLAYRRVFRYISRSCGTRPPTRNPKSVHQCAPAAFSLSPITAGTLPAHTRKATSSSLVCPSLRAATVIVEACYRPFYGARTEHYHCSQQRRHHALSIGARDSRRRNRLISSSEQHQLLWGVSPS